MDISPAELSRMIQSGLVKVAQSPRNVDVEFSRVPEGNSRIQSFDIHLSNGQAFTIRVEEAY